MHVIYLTLEPCQYLLTVLRRYVWKLGLLIFCLLFHLNIFWNYICKKGVIFYNENVNIYVQSLVNWNEKDSFKKHSLRICCLFIIYIYHFRSNSFTYNLPTCLIPTPLHRYPWSRWKSIKLPKHLLFQVYSMTTAWVTDVSFRLHYSCPCLY